MLMDNFILFVYIFIKNECIRASNFDGNCGNWFIFEFWAKLYDIAKNKSDWKSNQLDSNCRFMHKW